MAYIGKTPSSGIRNRFIYTATAGQTTFSGTDDHNRTLSYTDAEFTDVFLNGVKLDKSDYTATSGTSIVLDSGATVGDTLEVLAFDTFSVFSGEFSQDVTVGGSTTLTGDLTVDTNTLHVDSSNNAVGILTTAPSNASLDIGGRLRVLQDAAATTGAVIIRESSGGVGGHIQFVSNANDAQRGFIAVDSASTMNLGGVAVKATSTPAFLARPTSTQVNIANDNSVVTVAMGTEIFDQGGNFASNTFTAPITGRYQFNVIVYLTQVDSTATYYQVRLDTSNRTYFGLLDFASADLGLGFQTIAISVLADMDANDTATVNIQQNAGSQQTDIGVESAFSGFLAC